MLRNIIAIILFVSCVFAGGCAFAKLGAILSEPSSKEKTIAPEFDISQYETGKVLVLVNASSWSKSHTNMRLKVTEKLNVFLNRSALISPERLYGYEMIARVRSTMPGADNIELAKKLGSTLMVLVEIEDYELCRQGSGGYYAGRILGSSSVYDVTTGEKLWPSGNESKTFKLNVNSGKSIDDVSNKLAVAIGYCVSRNFYWTSPSEYRIAEEVDEESYINKTENAHKAW